MLLEKKQIQAIFLFKLKMGHKAVETTLHIDSVFGPGTAKECTMRWWFRTFCKKDENLEDNSLTTTQEVAEELNVNHSTVIRLEANWKGGKAR